MFFFTSGLAFNLIDRTSARELFTRYCPTIAMPNRHQLAGPLLDSAYAAERDAVTHHLKNQRHVALMSDGWSNPRRESLINFIVTAPKMRPLLWSCRVTDEDSKTGAYMANMIGEVIDEIESAVGVNKVCSVTTDNASNMKNAWTLLETGRPGFLSTGCAAHTLILMMKDVLSIPDLARILSQAKEAVLFIRNHTATNARFRTDQEGDTSASQRGLKLPNITRWYSQYECTKLVIENDRVIRELVEDDELLEKYGQQQVSRLEEIVIPELFWAQGAVALQLLEPIHKCLAHFEKDTVCLSVIYQQFIELIRHPAYNAETPGVDEDTQQTFRDLIEYRWKLLHRESMGISYLLDHTKDTSTFVRTDRDDTIQHLEKLAARLGHPQPQIRLLCRQLSSFMTNKCNWGDEHRRRMEDFPPLEWWTWIGADDYPLLEPIAQRIFTIPTSSAAAKRSWSIFKFIHSPRRNQLGNEKVIKLAFVYSNNGPKNAKTEIIARPVADLVPLTQRGGGATETDSESQTLSSSESGTSELSDILVEMSGPDLDDTSGSCGESDCTEDHFGPQQWDDENNMPGDAEREWTV
ncbi:hypothetical protein BBJ28_00012361 [Nothophytophthora sp. Chile5]|nr:hypothetical protein BBJ28_00012361 [Nothophytophthora sp. Chile5]